jgi:hypothetical protein
VGTQMGVGGGRIVAAGVGGWTTGVQTGAEGVHSH